MMDSNDTGNNTSMKNSVRFGIILGLAVLLSLCIGTASGILVSQALQSRSSANTNSSSATDASAIKLISEAWQIIRNNYVDQPSATAKTLAYGAITGMASALGDTDHTRFETPAMLKDEQRSISGTFEGIGATVGTKDGNTVIIAPFDNSPAQKAGILPGDIIQKVDGVDMTGQSLTDVVSHILGPAGTKVTLTILRPGTKEVKEFTVTRAKITINNVTWGMIPGTKIAHVRLAEFSVNVTRDLQDALKAANNANATSIVLDLRNNPGGAYDESIKVASQFLSGGNVLQTKDVTGKVTNVPVRSGGVATKIPMVVLINEGTASASEIVTGALQDAKRGTVIGATTLGTGTVLTTFPLSDGSAMLLATQEWLTPSGRVIWHKGLVPDIQVALPTGIILMTPEGERGLTADQVNSSGDTQLLKAIEVLGKATPNSISPQTDQPVSLPIFPPGETIWAIPGWTQPFTSPVIIVH